MKEGLPEALLQRRMQSTFIWHGALLCTSPAVFTAKGGAAKDEGSRPVGRP